MVYLVNLKRIKGGTEGIQLLRTFVRREREHEKESLEKKRRGPSYVSFNDTKLVS